MTSRLSVKALRELLAGPSPPVVLDVRRAQAFADSPAVIPGATRQLPDSVDSWAADLPRGCQVVAYCVLGQQVSQGVVARLEQLGIEASFLEGGIEQWKADGAPVSSAPADPASEPPPPGKPDEAASPERRASEAAGPAKIS
jgi:thiosulfate sulfurtransferase